jgi:hypothetical protein
MQRRVQAWRSAIGQEQLEALQTTINTAIGAMEQALAILAGAAGTLLTVFICGTGDRTKDFASPARRYARRPAVVAPAQSKRYPG